MHQDCKSPNRMLTKTVLKITSIAFIFDEKPLRVLKYCLSKGKAYNSIIFVIFLDYQKCLCGKPITQKTT